jgi:SAM-dependent methyltransferase
VQAVDILAGANATNVVTGWDDAHRYTPAPRHRRRLILNMLRGLEFADCLDAGCAQPFLLRAIVERYRVAGHGCDISDRVMAQNREALPGCTFRVLDLTREAWPDDRRFDLVVCSEVLEHLADWKAAVANLVRMARKELLITVPGGPIRTMDRMVGHLQHYRGPELCTALEENGCSVRRVRYWGFPCHTLYKTSISGVSPAKVYTAFSGGGRYGLGKRCLAHALYALFFVNDLFGSGYQLFVHARPPAVRPARVGLSGPTPGGVEAVRPERPTCEVGPGRPFPFPPGGRCIT